MAGISAKNKWKRYKSYWYRQVRKLFKKPPERDAYVISFPKSGRTWLRVMVDRLNDTGLSIGWVHGGADTLKAVPYHKLHFRLTKFQPKKIVLLVRDPRDTVVSAFYQAHDREGVFDGTISEFIRHPRFGIQKVLAFHQLCFENAPLLKSYHLVRYETLQEDTIGELRKVCNYLGFQPTEEALQNTMDFAAFDNLKALAQQGAFEGTMAYKLSPTEAGNPDSGKLRKGKVGGYKEELGSEDVAWCEEVMRREANPYYSAG